MKKQLLSIATCLGAFAVLASSTIPDVHIDTVNAEVKGEWIGKFSTASNYAAQTHTPMILVYSKSSGCDYCNQLKAALKGTTTTKFTTWMAGDGAKFVYALSSESVAASFAKPTGSTGFPFVSLWWDDGTTVHKINYTGRVSNDVKTNGSDPDKLAALIVDRATEFFKDYSEVSNGGFVAGSTASDRLEATANGVTTYVDVPLKREGDVSQAVANTLYATVSGQTVSYDAGWESGESAKYVRVTIPYGLAAGDSIALALKDANGASVATSVIAVVVRETNPKNPLWFGERTASTLRAGEWTTDRDLALACANAAGGSTLTLIGGSLWCPDCVNADAYLVDTAFFRNWAAANSIYCAAVDVSAFPKNGKTCLLTYEPTTVSDRYVKATVPNQDCVQSGAGYLSRKMIPQTGNDGINATAIWARNLDLATNSVANGGLCRPECLDSSNADTGSWKTGVPCFVLQNAAGEIKGRLYQFSNVSPTNDATAAAYVQRLEELRGLADDPTEELNKHWLTATTDDCGLALDGGCVNSTISAIDTSDFWRLEGRDLWTRGSFTVKGASGATGETNARLNLWKKSGNTAETIASASGNLAAGFTLSGQEITADAGVDYFIQLEVIDTSAAFALDREGDSVVAYTLTATSAVDPGVVALTATSATASEADAKKAGGTLRVYIPLERIGGATGATNAVLTLDAEATTAFDDRYAIVSDTVTWADGEMGLKSCIVDVYDDSNADGTQVVVFRFGAAAYTLTITDNDKLNVGKLSLGGVDPATAKKGVVIAGEGLCITIGVTRINGASGDVGCTLKTTAGAFPDGNALAWTSREADGKTLPLRLPTLAECPSAKVTVSFASLSGIAAYSSSRTLAVQLVAADAPRFEVAEKAYSPVRYCTFSQEVAIVNLSEGATAKIAKLSGTLPSGVTVKLVGTKLVVAGVPTKAGAFEAVYQVSQVLNRKTTPGLTIRLAFAVTDVAALDPSAPGANPSVAKNRSFGDQPVVDADDCRLTGILLNLTIPSTGKCSAKYKCAAGTISLSAKSWTLYDADTGTLVSRLADRTGSYTLDVSALADGTVMIELTDPAFSGGAYAGEVDAGWSTSDPATAWGGYYTVAIDSLEHAQTSGTVLATGNPYVTLKMQSATQYKKGTMSYAGVLPNGQSFSGSGTLVREGFDTAFLPVFYSTKKDCFTLAPLITSGAPAQAVNSNPEIKPWWRHTETVEAACWEVCYPRVSGSYYDKNVDLTDTLSASANGHVLSTDGVVASLEVEITSKTVTFANAAAARKVSARLTFNKTTGLVSGSFKTVNSAGKSVTATYKGVVLPDWGDGCPSCGDVPWASGSFWYTDALSYPKGGKTATLNVKFGGTLYLESF